MGATWCSSFTYLSLCILPGAFDHDVITGVSPYFASCGTDHYVFRVFSECENPLSTLSMVFCTEYELIGSFNVFYMWCRIFDWFCDFMNFAWFCDFMISWLILWFWFLIDILLIWLKLTHFCLMSDFNQNIIIDLSNLMSDILITCLILLMMDNFWLFDWNWLKFRQMYDCSQEFYSIWLYWTKYYDWYCLLQYVLCRVWFNDNNLVERAESKWHRLACNISIPALVAQFRLISGFGTWWWSNNVQEMN